MLTYSQFTLINEQKESEEPKSGMSEVEMSAGRQWHQANPVHYGNIVRHFDQATKKERHDGMNWYRQAHEVAKTISRSTNHPLHTVAGLASVYSPQTDWHNNMIVASRVARHGKATGGKTQLKYYKYGKSFAGQGQKDSAQRLLNGEHYNDVIKGHKTNAFAKLIHHGGDTDPHTPDVVVDRHAHSVASGARITDAAFGMSGLKGKRRYGELKQAYVDAAHHINKKSGAQIGDAHYVHPHQVQATTWLVRQRLNNEEDVARASGGNKKTAKALVKAGKSRETARAKWKTYAGTWHPGVSHLFENEEE